MSNIANILTHLQIVKEISSFPDEAILSAELAAIFLGVSTKTLASLRQAGDGPAYTQYPKSGSKARNQRVNYIFGNLRKWRDAQVVESTMDAAVKRGLAFLSISDLITPQPFWIINNLVTNHVFCSTTEQFRENLHNPEATVNFMTWNTALGNQWVNNQAREPFFNSYTKLLKGLIDAVKH
jgi:hypothetical protein